MFLSMDQIKLSINELEEHLIEQIKFLETSCELYDAGETNEAKIIALCIRILLHDSISSNSLLGQLQKKSNLFYSSNLLLSKESITSFFGLTMIGLKGESTKYYPKLDEMSFNARWLTFDEWWNEIIFRDKDLNILTRKSLIQITADQNGGAHVDEKIDEIYYNLSRKNSLNFELISKDIKKDIPEAEKSEIRQIGHEILKTLNTDYFKIQKAKVDTWIVSPEIIPCDKSSSIPQPTKIGRNEKCPCGSGMKFKKCHGK